MSYSAEMRFEDGTAGLREDGFYGGEDSYLEESYEDRSTGGADYVGDEYSDGDDDYPDDPDDDEYSDGFGNRYSELPDYQG